MNIRKNIDYSDMFTAMDAAVDVGLSQMKLYCELGRLVCERAEKGAAVAAAEYLHSRFPDVSGFSPRNLRRMREFYRMYAGNAELLALAMKIAWTQNVVILEAKLEIEERRWYLRAVGQFGWSKAELQRKIKSNAHLEMQLDELENQCYTEFNRNDLERTEYDQDTFHLSRQYLQKPNGSLYQGRFGEESGIGGANQGRLCRHQHRGDRKPSLSSGTAKAGRVWDRMPRACGQADEKGRLFRL